MTTKIYGLSDDLIEVDGDVDGEVGCFGTGDRDRGVLLSCSDGSLLEIKYGKAGSAIWAIIVLREGELFDALDICYDESALPYSDVARFKDGLEYIMASTQWKRV